MARNTIKFELKKALEQQASYGRSKHQDKLTTYEKRSEMKAQGATYEERLAINDMKNHIYSYGTMKTYQQQVGYFGDYLIKEGHKKIGLEESKDYIQEYINHMVSEEKSPWTINTALASICKATGANIHDYEHPSRSISKIDRGNAERLHDKYNEKNYADILEANRLLGMRRSELKNLRAENIIERNGNVVISIKGKGGRANEHIFILDEEKHKVLALKEGKEPHEKIFSRDMFHNDADLHRQRQLRAVEVYNRTVKDMDEHPERRDYYKQQIYQAFADHGRTCKENLDNPYCVRGDNRQRLQMNDKDLSYDRVAVLFVSCTVLCHTRSDVTVEHYIAKS
mgnify:CR=1 FL=1